MAKAKRFLLADIDGRSGLLPDALDRLQRLSALLHRRFKFVGDVEVILERRFAASGDEDDLLDAGFDRRSEEHTSELQSLMRISYAVFCLNKKTRPATRDATNNHGTSHAIH